MGVKLSEMTADTSVAGTEKLLSLDGTTSKTVTPAKLAEYTIDVLYAASSATPTTGDTLIGYRSTDEKKFTLDAVSSYALTYAYSNATTLTPAATGDSILVQRSGVVYDMNVSTLATYVLTGVQATVLDLSGLSAATLVNTDLLAICQTTTAKKATIASLETLLWTDFATYAGALSAATTVADADKFYILQSGTPKYVTGSVLSTYIDTDAPWKTVAASKYTATPASTSTITMSDSSDFKVGYPVKYTYGGTAYYGIATTVAANLLTIAGAGLDTGVALTALEVGRPERVIVKEFFIDTAAFDAVQDIFSAITYQNVLWEHADAYLVMFKGALGVVDTGAQQPKINVKIAGGVVSNADTAKGPTMSGTVNTFVATAATTIDTSAYDIARGDALEIRCTEAGTNGDADCLSVICTFVLE